MKKVQHLLIALVAVCFCLLPLSAQNTNGKLEPFVSFDKIGFLNEDGKIVIPAQFQAYSPWKDDVHRLEKGGKWALFDNASGQWLTPIGKYDGIEKPFDGFAIVREGDLYGLINMQGEEVVPVSYPAIGIINGHYFYQDKEEKMGLVLPSGELLPGKEGGMVGFGDNRYTFLVTDGVCRVLDRQGEHEFSFACDSIGFFSEDVLPFYKKKKWGAMRIDGSVVFSPKYQKIAHFEGGMCGVVKDDRWGYVDKSGKLAIPNKYENGMAFDNYSQITAVKWKGKWGLVDRTGKEVEKFAYESYSASLMWIFLKDSQGNEVIFDRGTGAFIGRNLTWLQQQALLTKGQNEPEYGMEYDLKEYGYHIARFLKTNKYHIWTADSRPREGGYDFIDRMYAARNESPKLFKAQMGKQWYIIDEHETVLAGPFQSLTYKLVGIPLFVVKKDGKWGIIDKSMKTVYPFVANTISYSQGRFIVFQNGKYGLVDNKGAVLGGFQWDEIVAMGTNTPDFRVKKGKKYGVIDNQGTVIVEPEYRVLHSFSDHVSFAVKESDKTKILAINEKWTVLYTLVVKECKGLGGYHNGLAIIQDKKQYYLINKLGEILYYFPEDASGEFDDLIDEYWKKYDTYEDMSVQTKEDFKQRYTF